MKLLPCYGLMTRYPFVVSLRNVSFTQAMNNNIMKSSNGTIFRVTGPLCGEFTGSGEFPAQRPVTRSFDVFFDLRLSKLLSKQPWGWWFETPPWSLWRQCNQHTITRSIYFVFCGTGQSHPHQSGHFSSTASTIQLRHHRWSHLCIHRWWNVD